jgi:hypothetical protein
MLNARQLSCAEGITLEALTAICDSAFPSWPDARIDRLVKALDEAGTSGIGRAALCLISERMSASFAARRAALQAEYDVARTERDALRAAE